MAWTNSSEAWAICLVPQCSCRALWAAERCSYSCAGSYGRSAIAVSLSFCWRYRLKTEKALGRSPEGCLTVSHESGSRGVISHNGEGQRVGLRASPPAPCRALANTDERGVKRQHARAVGLKIWRGRNFASNATPSFCAFARVVVLRSDQ